MGKLHLLLITETTSQTGTLWQTFYFLSCYGFKFLQNPPHTLSVMGCTPLCFFALVYSEESWIYPERNSPRAPSEQQGSFRITTITTHRIPEGSPNNLQTLLSKNGALSADPCQSCAQHLVFLSLPLSLPFSDTQLRLCQGWLPWLRHHFNCY